MVVDTLQSDYDKWVKSRSANDASMLNLKVVMFLNKAIKNPLSENEIIRLRTFLEEVTIATITELDAPEIFVDCANTFRTLLLSSNNKIMYPESANTSTFNAISLMLCYYLVRQELESFETLMSVVHDEAHPIFQKGVESCTTIKVIADIHDSLMTGSLEATFNLIIASHKQSGDRGFVRLTEQLADTTRELISASLESSYSELSLSNVLKMLHLDSVGELNEWINSRNESRQEYLDIMAIPEETADLKLNGKSVSELTKRLMINDLVQSNTEEISDHVHWEIDADSNLIHFVKHESDGNEKSKKDLSCLDKLRELYGFGEYLEAAL